MPDKDFKFHLFSPSIAIRFLPSTYIFLVWKDMVSLCSPGCSRSVYQACLPHPSTLTDNCNMLASFNKSSTVSHVTVYKTFLFYNSAFKVSFTEIKVLSPAKAEKLKLLQSFHSLVNTYTQTFQRRQYVRPVSLKKGGKLF